MGRAGNHIIARCALIGNGPARDPGLVKGSVREENALDIGTAVAHLIAQLVFQLDGAVGRVDEHVMADNAEADLIGGVSAQIQRVMAVVDGPVAGDHIIARGVDNGVVPAPGRNNIVAGPAEQLIVAGITKELIVVIEALDNIVVGCTDQNIRPGCSDDRCRGGGFLPVTQGHTVENNFRACAICDLHVAANLSKRDTRLALVGIYDVSIDFNQV